MATGSAPEQEQFNDAVVTARNISGQIDQPAWVYVTPEYVPGLYLSKYQVACMEWRQLSEATQRAVVAVVLPTGQEFVKLEGAQLRADGTVALPFG